MGLSVKSTGAGVKNGDVFAVRKSGGEKIVALAGNPNVGKSTVFNALTGLHQHTGNWAGKTVSTADGAFKTASFSYIAIDLPGTYSLLAHSAEEEAARNFLCFSEHDAVVVVCDATCLERGLNLALQVMELCPKTLVCVNLLDEARRNGVELELGALERSLGVPVVGTNAHDKKTLKRLTERLDELCAGKLQTNPRRLRYTKPIEDAIALVEPYARRCFSCPIPARRVALALIDDYDGDSSLVTELEKYNTGSADEKEALNAAVERARELLTNDGITPDILKDRIVSCILQNAEEICGAAVKRSARRVSKADRVLTSRLFGYPIMILMLLGVFWLTIVGANYPSELLGTWLFKLGDLLRGILERTTAPAWLSGILIDGAYRVLAWVVSVMLPPMAIFFPLFTLLEDLGFLPRVAYNLDRPFCKCRACGKQALTMCIDYTILYIEYELDPDHCAVGISL